MLLPLYAFITSPRPKRYVIFANCSSRRRARSAALARGGSLDSGAGTPSPLIDLSSKPGDLLSLACWPASSAKPTHSTSREALRTVFVK
jgi:hypothetical protein